MKRQFDRQEAKKFLLAREEKEKQQQEENHDFAFLQCFIAFFKQQAKDIIAGA
jgi:hypothetical protein